MTNTDDGSDPQNSFSDNSSSNTFGFHRVLGATPGAYVLDELDGEYASSYRTEDAQGTVQPGASGTNITYDETNGSLDFGQALNPGINFNLGNMYPFAHSGTFDSMAIALAMAGVIAPLPAAEPGHTSTVPTSDGGYWVIFSNEVLWRHRRYDAAGNLVEERTGLHQPFSNPLTDATQDFSQKQEKTRPDAETPAVPATELVGEWQDYDIDGDGVRNRNDSDPWRNHGAERQQRAAAGWKYGIYPPVTQQAFFQVKDPLAPESTSLPSGLEGFTGTAKFNSSSGSWSLYDESGNYIGNYYPNGTKSHIRDKVYRYSSLVATSSNQHLMVDIEDLLELFDGTFARGPSFPTDQDGWNAYFLQHHNPEDPGSVPTEEEMEHRLAGAGPAVVAMLTNVVIELGLELGGARIVGYAVGKGSKLLLKLENGTELLSPEARKHLDKLSSLNASILRKNLGLRKGDLRDAHHIVPSTHSRAQEARDLLDRFGIDINDAVNGAPVSKPIHGLQHNGPAIDKVTKRLEEAIDGIDDEVIAKASLLEELQNLKIDILNGNFP